MTVHVFEQLFKHLRIAQIWLGDFGVLDVAGPRCNVFVDRLPFGEFFVVCVPEVFSPFGVLVFLGGNAREANLGKAA